MGRKPSRWTNLPTGMRARPRGKTIHYYLDTGGKPRKEIPLGSDYVLAVQKWAELTSQRKPPGGEITFAYVLGRYWEDVIPTKAAETQRGNNREKLLLLRFFDDPPAPLDTIQPVHLRQYMDWRVKETRAAAVAKNEARVKAGKEALPIDPKKGQTRANREKALFSHIWNYAREQGYTALANPCTGIKGFKETGRDTLIDEELMSRAMQHADAPLQFAMRLADLTGQRPGDVLRMSESHISNGVLNIRQGKTGARLRIVIEGVLAQLLDEIRAYKSGLKVHAMSLLVNDAGQPLTTAMLRNRFDSAREAAGIPKKDFQFRDLRAKAATETDEGSGTPAAQALLGHTTETMTTTYIRNKVGRKVRLLGRK